MKKTHKVLDLIYTEEEDNSMFCGTLLECETFVSEQSSVVSMMQVVPMSKWEIDNYPDNQ